MDCECPLYVTLTQEKGAAKIPTALFPDYKFYYLTVTTQVRITFPAFTVMVAVPFFFAVTLPFALTVATFLLELR